MLTDLNLHFIMAQMNAIHYDIMIQKTMAMSVVDWEVFIWLSLRRLVPPFLKKINAWKMIKDKMEEMKIIRFCALLSEKGGNIILTVPTQSA